MLDFDVRTQQTMFVKNEPATLSATHNGKALPTFFLQVYYSTIYSLATFLLLGGLAFASAPMTRTFVRIARCVQF